MIASVDPILAAGHFELKSKVRANGHMMSLVYARDVPWSAKLATLPDRFSEWLSTA